MAEVDIIDLWKKGKELSIGGEDPNIDELITKKSKTPLYWIKVILWIEFWINAISLPIVYYYRSIDPIFYGIVTPILILIYLVYYQFLIQKIRKFDFSEDVKSGLRKLYNYLNFFFLHYKVIIWVSLIFGLVYGIVGTHNNSELPEDPTLKFWLFVVGFGVVMITVVGLILNFLINLIYGRKIKRLRLIVKEFEKNES